MSVACLWTMGLYLLVASEVQTAPARQRTHAGTGAPPHADDPTWLRELLYDRQQPRQQSQAALLLLMNPSAPAAETVRQGLRQSVSPEVFLALTSALRLRRDARFNDELFTIFTESTPERRQLAAETLAHVLDDAGVRRLAAIAANTHADLVLRQAALFTLGRCGRKQAAAVLIDHLSAEPEALRRVAIESLATLSGHDLGSDVLGWKAWWESHRDLADSAWLHERLQHQASKSRRLEGDLDRARAEVVRLHQQLYARLPASDRLSEVQFVMTHEDPAVRGLAVVFCAELLPGSQGVGQRALADVLLRLAQDRDIEVQGAAVRALGRVLDPRVCSRLRRLLAQAAPAVRAAAARALTQQAGLPRPADKARVVQRQVVPALQKALEDPALEVVVEAAEDLGTLGLPEAVPVLTGLLRHPSEPVRQTAAQALERVADSSVLDELLTALNDPAVGVRFCVIGAVGHAAGDGHALAPLVCARLQSRLEDFLVHDTDPGVRSRAASVLGECATPTSLTPLWQRVQASEDSRVQDKAWAAFVNIIVRSGSLDLLTTWEHALGEAHQPARQTHLLAAAVESWKKSNTARAAVAPALESLVQALLQQQKWAAAFPPVRELLTQPGSDADFARRLQCLLSVGEQALKDGKKSEALRAVQEAQPFLPRCRGLAPSFEKLEKQAGQS